MLNQTNVNILNDQKCKIREKSKNYTTPKKLWRMFVGKSHKSKCINKFGLRGLLCNYSISLQSSSSLFFLVILWLWTKPLLGGMAKLRLCYTDQAILLLVAWKCACISFCSDHLLLHTQVQRVICYCFMWQRQTQKLCQNHTTSNICWILFIWLWNIFLKQHTFKWNIIYHVRMIILTNTVIHSCQLDASSKTPGSNVQQQKWYVWFICSVSFERFV